MMDLVTVIERGTDFVFNEVDGELVMMNVETGAYASLNATGKSIWEALETPQPIGQIIKSLTEEYEIDEKDAISQVVPFIEKLIEQKIIISQ